jgi:type II secretory pathway pseudopilin PulG
MFGRLPASGNRPFLISVNRLQPNTERIRAAGISILELILVISILAILTALALPAYGFFKRKAEDAGCMSNMRSLHASLSAYMQDHAFVWPQNPYQLEPGSDPDQEAKWWIDELQPYGGTREVWLCPSERRGFAIDTDDEHYDMTYVPTAFDEIPNRAYQWSRQPWLIERGGFHDDGEANLIMPDGSMRKDKSPVPFK